MELFEPKRKASRKIPFPDRMRKQELCIPAPVTECTRRLNVTDPQTALNYQRALATFTRIVDEPASVLGLLQNAAVQVSRITHIKHVKVLRYRPDRGDLLVEAGVGWKAGVVGNVCFGADRFSAPGRSMQTGAPVAVEDIANDPDFRYAEVLRDHGIVSVLNVPIFVDGTHWGVFEVDTVEKRTFSEFEIHSLAIFANILGVSLAKNAAHNAAAKAKSLINDSKSEAAMMLRELQHRMKNNLQLIVSFLTLQGRESVSEETRDRMGRVLDRVMAIGLAHDQLSFEKSASSVDMRDYLKALCVNIDPRRPNLTIDTDFDSVSIPLDRAVPVGLIVNELVTNSVKYAFDQNGGTINVAFRANEMIGEAEVCVSDNGRGMGPARKGSLGLRLVQSLSRQLGGRLTTPEVLKGTSMVITFPYSV
jgi:two-component sensor histidine kinase